MLTKIKIVLAAAIALGTAAEASAVGVMPCSLVGVNSALHGDIFGKKHPERARRYGFIKLSDGGGKHGTWGVDPKVCGHS
jgi:hypothetical protein